LSSKGVRYASAGRDIGKHFIFTIRAVEFFMSALPPKAAFNFRGDVPTRYDLHMPRRVAPPPRPKH
jgi:hypothetical protein